MRLTDLADDISREMIEDAGRYAEIALAELRKATPVDTGALRASYRLSTGKGKERLGETLVIWTLEGEKFSTLDLGIHLGADGRWKGSPQAPNGIAAPAVLAADRRHG